MAAAEGMPTGSMRPEKEAMEAMEAKAMQPLKKAVL